MVKVVKNIVQILVSVFILAVAINMFLGPHDIAAGGVSGIGILAESALNIDRSIVVFVLNVIMLLLAIMFLGKKVFLNILFGSLAFPFALAVVPEVTLTTDRLLSVIFGSAVFAIGVAMLYRIRASSGGTTIPPLIFEKYFNLNTSIGLLLTDMVIVCMSLVVFGFEEFLYAILSIIITSMVMTYIETGTKRRKALMIVSPQNTGAIREALKVNLARGMTIFDVRGGHDDNAHEMILLTISNKEYPKALEIIDAIDPKCFLITYNVAEVHGLGFTYHPIQ